MCKMPYHPGRRQVIWLTVRTPITQHLRHIYPKPWENQTPDQNKSNLTLKIRGGGGELPYEKVSDVHRKIWIKPLKETNLGVAQA